VIPYLMVRDAAAALSFYAEAFGARERVRWPLPDGRIGHAEIELSDEQVWLADESPELGCPGPQTLGGAGAMVFVYLPDVDSICARAVAAGAVVVRPLADQFWGDRTVTLRDPFGHVWTLATRKERMTLAEATRRARERS
jgi:PhnB protein